MFVDRTHAPGLGSVHPAAFLPPASVKQNAAAQAKGGTVEQQEIERVSGEFAAILVQNLVREMFETVKEGEGPFGSGPGSDIQRSMAETAFSQSLTEQGLDSLKDAIARAVNPGERVTAEEAATALAARRAADRSTEQELKR